MTASPVYPIDGSYNVTGLLLGLLLILSALALAQGVLWTVD